MKDDFPQQIFGHFSVGKEQHAGIITLDGASTKIEIYADQLVPLDESQLIAVHGISRDGRKITACHCVSAGKGHAYYYGTRREMLTLFPHYVALGPDHLCPTQREIGTVAYTFPRAVDLFYDRAIAGELKDTQELRKLISDHSDKRADGRDIAYALIFYWANRGPIIEVTHSDLRVTACAHVITSCTVPIRRFP